MAGDRGIEGGGDIDGSGGEDLVIVPAFDGDGAAGQGVRVGQEGIRYHQVTVDGRQGGDVTEQVRVEQIRVQTLVIGARDGFRQ